MGNIDAKHESIVGLLDRLTHRLHEDSFDIVDYWDSDPYAIGIARPGNHGVLVYVSTYRQPPEACFVSLELPPQSSNDGPYIQGAEYQARSFEKLVRIIEYCFSRW